MPLVKADKPVEFLPVTSVSPVFEQSFPAASRRVCRDEPFADVVLAFKGRNVDDCGCLRAFYIIGKDAALARRERVSKAVVVVDSTTPDAPFFSPSPFPPLAPEFWCRRCADAQRMSRSI